MRKNIKTDKRIVSPFLVKNIHLNPKMKIFLENLLN